MNILQTLQQLRDDIKSWVTTNLSALNAKIDEKTIPIDGELDSNSTNPVQNKAIATEIADINNRVGNTPVATQISNAIAQQPHFSGDYNDLTNAPNITEDDSGSMTIADESGNIIFKVDASGIHTTALNLNGEAAATEKYVDDAIAEIPKTDLSNYYNKEETDTVINTAKEELSESIVSEQQEFHVVDEAGNIITSIDSNGIATTTIAAQSITVNGESIATESYVDEAIANIEFPTTDLSGKADVEHKHVLQDITDFPTNLATIDDVNNAIADFIEADPVALEALQELSQAIENHEDAYGALLETVGSKATKTDLENLKTEISESIVSETEEFHIVDEAGNIVASIDANGVTTTTVTAQDVVIEGTSIKDTLTEITTDTANQVIVALADAQKYTDDVFATIEIPTVPTKISAFENDKGYLTEHQSIKTINGESLIGEGNITTAAITDAEELPTENINTQSFYRTPTGKVIKAEIAVAGNLMPELGEVEVVDVLPSVGKSAIDLTSETYCVYYLTSENAVYGYIPALLSAELGVPEGWYKPEELGMTAYIVDSVEEAVTEDLYVVVTRQPQLFHYFKDNFERIAVESYLENYKAIKEIDDFNNSALDTHSLYRSQGKVTKVEAVINQEILPADIIDIVDTLPETGEPFTDGNGDLHFTYQRSDNLIYGYVDETLRIEFAMASTGWVSLDVCLVILNALNNSGVTFGGNISSIEQATDSTKIYALVTREARKPTLHYYREVENGFAKGEIGAGYSETIVTKTAHEEEIIPETTVNFIKDMPTDSCGSWNPDKEILKPDCIYTITFDGQTYERPSKIEVTSDVQFRYSGNLAIIGNGLDTGEPFCIIAFSMHGSTEVITLVGASEGNHTIAIKETSYIETTEEVIHKIDPKYYDAGSTGSNCEHEWVVEEALSALLSTEPYTTKLFKSCKKCGTTLIERIELTEGE